MKSKKKFNRREFTNTSVAAEAGVMLTVPTIVPASVFDTNDRVMRRCLVLTAEGKAI